MANQLGRIELVNIMVGYGNLGRTYINQLILIRLRWTIKLVSHYTKVRFAC
jgi:hypothetical protein